MKKIISLFLAILMCFAVAGCNTDDMVPAQTDEPSDVSHQTSATVGEESDIITQEFEHYSLEYVSNKDGTCYVSKIINEYVNDLSYDLIIPEAGPNGDSVVEVEASLYKMLAPEIILKEDYDKIAIELQKKVDSGELSRFEVLKNFEYRYVEVFPSNETNAELLEGFKQRYPFANCMVDFYVCDAISLSEHYTVSSFWRENLGYDLNQLKETYSHLYDVCEKTLSDPQQKQEVLSWLSRIAPMDGYGYSNCIKSIQLPNTIKILPTNIYYHCPALTEITISEYFKDISEIDLGLLIDSDVFRDNVVYLEKINILAEIDTLKGAFEHSELSVTLPASLKNIEHAEFLYYVAEITFKGTVEQWNALATQLPDWRYKCGSDITIHCSDGTVTIKPYFSIFE